MDSGESAMESCDCECEGRTRTVDWRRTEPRRPEGAGAGRRGRRWGAATARGGRPHADGGSMEGGAAEGVGAGRRGRRATAMGSAGAEWSARGRPPEGVERERGGCLAVALGADARLGRVSLDLFSLSIFPCEQ